MKDTIKNVLILILCAIVAYLFFNEPEIEVPTEVLVEEELPIKLANLSGIITWEEARKLQDSFINTRAKIFERDFNYTDARSYTLSLDKIENYAKFIRHTYGSNPKYPNLGFRFYLGAKQEGSLNEGISTMFIVPTTTPNSRQKGSFFNAIYIEEPQNINNAPIQDQVGEDNPPHNL